MVNTTPQWRFIPTRVGNTSSVLIMTWVSSVHPHACGEYWLPQIQAPEGRGSSPRVWGILAPGLFYLLRIRFIPTRVGNTHVHRRGQRRHTVHPHACGEYMLISWPTRSIIGSSPRVWGILRIVALLARCGRFIPTRVGNTTAFPARPCSCPVHPHACGEYLRGTPM